MYKVSLTQGITVSQSLLNLGACESKLRSMTFEDFTHLRSTGVKF